MNRFHARRAARRKVDTAFAIPPEPRTIGRVARGRQLVDGKFLFSGLLVEEPGRSIWDVAPHRSDIGREIQGCTWLDDLAAIGTEPARALAQSWVFDWITRYGDGRDAGWTPDLTGRRLMRWINHGPFILRRQDEAQRKRFFTSLGQQSLFLARRWHTAPEGLPRLEAQAGAIHAALLLNGMDEHADRPLAAMQRDCDILVDADGAIANRNPEDLLQLFSLLVWTTQSLELTSRAVPDILTGAIDRIAPTLRALRHTDGGLARFHGGGRGPEGRLDAALMASKARPLDKTKRHMGYLRLAFGRTSLLVDAAQPPTGQASANAHASTLALELTSGRRPVIVNCGPGALFGGDWQRASRATPSHSTLGIDGASSSDLQVQLGGAAGTELLAKVPANVTCEFPNGHRQRRVELSHDGYVQTHGMSHGRMLDLSFDGRKLQGEDILAALDEVDKARFDDVLGRSGGEGIAFSLRFHLHPDVAPTFDAARQEIAITLPSGEEWSFHHDQTAKLALAPSVYLENGRLKPRQTQQVVLSGRALSYATSVRWSFTKVRDASDGGRDLLQEDLLDAID
ncbi:heparinase II/III family protein [Yoonia sp. SS1-5]|uniref:Heparinase II/III family protein n=1 Tax=Yoonia rhodophyticola TaxID=3137370 RepID=A0AAN0MBK0_9RHOB